MEKVLLVGHKPYFRDMVSFLLKLAGCEPVLVRDLEEAINLVEIKQSISSSFDLLILSDTEIDYGISLYEQFFNRIIERIKILIIGGGGIPFKNDASSSPFFSSENIYFCTLENLVYQVRKILDKVNR